MRKIAKIVALVMLCVSCSLAVSAQSVGVVSSCETMIAELIAGMVRVEGGDFLMGAAVDDKEAYDWERPAHMVTIDDFYISRYEVTQALWEAVMGTNPSNFRNPSLPVEMVSYYECLYFIHRLNEMTGNRYNFRLPTEQEWEYAARGGRNSQGYKYSGGDDLEQVACCDANAGGMTHEVATKRANELGLYDMTGNVWEWTSSDWRLDYNSEIDSSCHVIRGGSWINGTGISRVTYRSHVVPVFQDYYLGLRLVCDKM